MRDKIIFLDIDGVMNCCKPPNREIEGLQEDETFEEYAVENLNSIVEEMDCDIVISSAWRVYYKIEDLKVIFEKNGFKYSERIIDYTPRLDRRLSEFIPRGREIDKWMKDNNFKGSFVILDDNGDMAHLQEFLVLTDSYEGLTNEMAEKVKTKFDRNIMLLSEIVDWLESEKFKFTINITGIVAEKGIIKITLVYSGPPGVMNAILTCHIGDMGICLVLTDEFLSHDVIVLKQSYDKLLRKVKNYLDDLDSARNLVHEWENNNKTIEKKAE